MSVDDDAPLLDHAAGSGLIVVQVHHPEFVALDATGPEFFAAHAKQRRQCL